MFGEVVDGIDRASLRQRAHRRSSARAACGSDVDLGADDLRGLVETFKGIYARSGRASSRRTPRAQLLRAVAAVFDVVEHPARPGVPPRARDPRRPRHRRQRRADGVRQQGRALGDGRRVHARPVDRRARLYGEFLANAQGEDVVAGIRTPQPIEAMGAALPDAYDAADRDDGPARAHYRDVQDIEFTVEDDRLYLLQTRSAKRTAAAALKAAVAMVDEGLITREEAVVRIDASQLDQLLHPMIDPGAALEPAGRGPERVARGGKRRDRVRRRHRRRACGKRARAARPLRDDAGRHPRDDRRGGNPHRARRHDVARRRGRARDGEAVRRRLRRPRARRGGAHGDDRVAHAARGRPAHDRRRHRAGVRRRGAARAAAAERGLRDSARLGRRACAAWASARTRDTPEDATPRPRVRRRRHRPRAGPSTCSSATSGCRSCRR